jgi:hypothetical protein
MERKVSMPTVVELTEEELAELRESTQEADPAVAVRTAMREYLRYVRRMQLKQLSGRVEMQENWTALFPGLKRYHPD